MLFLKRRFLKSILCACLAVSVLMAMLSGCTQKTPAATPTLTAGYPGPKIMLTTADLDTTCEEPNRINLEQVTDDVCLITQPGCYVLSGELNGSIRIDAEDQIVHLVLDGVTVDSSYGSALEVVSAGKVILTLQEGSDNSFLDSGTYPESSDPDACIYSPCDLTINGSGSLNVHGYYKDAIHTKDTLKVLGGILFVQSKRDGLRGNDGIVVNCESLTVQSEGNGLHSTKTGKETKGNIEIYGSTCSIIGGKYAVSCASDLYVADSSIYAMGVYANMQTGGEAYIAEGSLQNE